jgi:hypothetical protein
MEGIQSMNYKMIAIDMDGTLLNSQKRVTERTKEVLITAQESGKKIIITTGRIFTSARLYSQYIGLKTPIIACNGAIIKGVEGKRIFKIHPVEEKIIVNAIEICNEIGVPYHFYSEDKIYATKKLDLYEFYHQEESKIDSSYSIPFYDINDFSSISKIKEEILKFNVWDRDVDKILLTLNKIKNINNAFVTSSSPYNIEITNQAATKGNALKDLGEFYGIKKEEIIAIGDSYNDISMIEYAGLGIAMDNSQVDIKEIADYITLSNDQEGIVDVFERFVL